MLRIRRFLSAFLLLVVCGCSHADAPSIPSAVNPALDDYMRREEPEYAWTKVEEKPGLVGTTTVLKVTSQTWQEGDWTQRVEIVRPGKIDFPDTAIVLASYGSPGETLLAQFLAQRAGATVVSVNNVPNQPLWNIREDDLIAHTFTKYLETGDATWPLLLPMTKAVIKSMDAVEEYSKEKFGKPLTKFVVGGASKRGWTAWLVAAADSKLHPGRVTGIIPLVYNNLNIPQQMPYQLESWGKYSDQIADYTRRGLQAKMATPQGQELVGIVDPYTYRDRLTMPKLLINGANDPYWTPDATQFYLNDLPGSTSLYFAPNAGHDLGGDFQGIMNVAASWFRQVASEEKVPVLRTLAFANLDPSFKNFGVGLTAPATSVQLWKAYSRTKDFRGANWKSQEMKLRPENSVTEGQPKDVEAYYSGFSLRDKEFSYVAVYATVEFKDSGVELSSPVQIFKLAPSNEF